jgi:acyl-CoA synthetase (AMP-forming)/AMP-acid ligase II
VQPSSLSVGCRVTVAEGPGVDSQLVVGCGRPLAGVSVEIADEQGNPLPEGSVGEIAVRGVSVAAGYADPSQSAFLTTLSDGTLRSGDAGFLLDGQLHVLGRLGDSVKVRGRALFAEDLESSLRTAGVPAARVAALLGYRDGEPTVVAMFEQPQKAWLSAAEELLRRRSEGALLVLVDAPRGAITRTPNGKPKRRQLWQAFLDNQLPGTIVVADPNRATSTRGDPDV